MSEKRVFTLAHDEARRRAVATVLAVPVGYSVTVEPPKRSLDANAKFHALCEEAEKSGIPWAGRPRTAAEWKVLFVSGHSVATKQGAEIVPGLEGEFINIRESTARMSRARSASLIDYAQAFLAQHSETV